MCKILNKLFLWAVACSLFFSCQRRAGDATLAYFGADCTVLAPYDSVKLDDAGILFPTKIFVSEEKAFVVKQDGKDLLFVLNLQDGSGFSAFRKGRGPGEFIEPTQIDMRGDSLYVYDINQGVWSRVLAGSLRSEGPQVFDTLRSFRTAEMKGDDFLYVPTDAKSAGRGYVALAVSPYWYCMVDWAGDKVGGGIAYLDLEELSGFYARELVAFYRNSATVVSPDNTKVACAVYSGSAISFASVEGTDLVEKKRLVFEAPRVLPVRREGYPLIQIDQECIRGFVKLFADDRYVYGLYSGKLRSDKSGPAFECQHVLVFDWEGRPVRRYLLENTVCGICVEKGILYGVSMHPESRLYKYRIDL